jgi:hypothetical protein
MNTFVSTYIHTYIHIYVCACESRALSTMRVCVCVCVCVCRCRCVGVKVCVLCVCVCVFAHILPSLLPLQSARCVLLSLNRHYRAAALQVGHRLFERISRMCLQRACSRPAYVSIRQQTSALVLADVCGRMRTYADVSDVC